MWSSFTHVFRRHGGGGAVVRSIGARLRQRDEGPCRMRAWPCRSGRPRAAYLIDVRSQRDAEDLKLR